MTQPSNNSSLPILLTITGAVILSAAGGWYLLGQDSPVQEQAEPSPVVEILELVEEEIPAEPVVEAPLTDIDAELRKARLATEADILAFPRELSAIYFYGRILSAEPEHAVARAEFDAVLSRLAQIVGSHLAAEEYSDAYQLSVLVSRYRPEHPLVIEVQQILDRNSGALIDQAMDFARDGNEEAAAKALTEAEDLPGRDQQYFAAVRDSVEEISNNLRSAKERRVANARLASTAADNAWMEKVRAAIDAGQLANPPGANAVDYLTERESTDPVQQQMQVEVLAALTSTISVKIETDQLIAAEALLNSADTVATDSTDDAGELAELRASLEQALIDVESKRLARMEELVRLNVVAARYPRRAESRGISGWVEIMFTVTPTGETSDIDVAGAEPLEIFDDSAIEAVEQWTFEPKEFRGRTISQRAIARLVYRLQ